mmetsp:Transcript_3811/g.7838  ORF Transcript_3811/g.7838 Transcript_3811/m.7838 type:complete len:284 (+) Transcript_3811:901-1752(+)
MVLAAHHLIVHSLAQLIAAPLQVLAHGPMLRCNGSLKGCGRPLKLVCIHFQLREAVLLLEVRCAVALHLRLHVLHHGQMLVPDLCCALHLCLQFMAHRCQRARTLGLLLQPGVTLLIHRVGHLLNLLAQLMIRHVTNRFLVAHHLRQLVQLQVEFREGSLALHGLRLDHRRDLATLGIYFLPVPLHGLQVIVLHCLQLCCHPGQLLRKGSDLIRHNLPLELRHLFLLCLHLELFLLDLTERCNGRSDSHWVAPLPKHGGQLRVGPDRDPPGVRKLQSYRAAHL